MTRKKLLTIVGVAVVLIVGITWATRSRPADLVLTGIVTTHEVIVSPQMAGQVTRLLVSEGDSVVPNQLLAVLSLGELQADQTYFTRSAEASASQVRESESDLRFEETQATQQLRQAQAALDAAIAQATQDSATFANAKRVLDRDEALMRTGAVAQREVDSARTAYTVAQARVDASRRQVEGQRAAVALARAAADQVAAKRDALAGARQQAAAATAQVQKAAVRLSYSELRAPIKGIVDVRAARQGEVVSAGQPVLTLIDPDSLWVRADVEETYIDRIKLGGHLTVRLPSGEEKQGTVVYRGVDAAFATQRDVSRTKRDIKTFEVRLRVDNHDRRLALGMTASVLLPVSGSTP
jgi:HlyD family secretion protein